jgi:hypothetical protein
MTTTTLTAAPGHCSVTPHSAPFCVPVLQGIVVAWRRLNATTHETYGVTEQTDLEFVR